MMTRQQIKEAVIASFGGEVLPGGFSAEVVANFFYRQMSEKGITEPPSREAITNLINRSQGW